MGFELRRCMRCNVLSAKDRRLVELLWHGAC